MDKVKFSTTVILIVTTFALVASFSMLNKSRTIDELAHIVGGTYYLHTLNNYVFIEQPILQSVFSLPTIINKNLVVKFPPAHMNDNIYGDNLKSVVLYARLINILMTIILSLFVVKLILKITKSHKTVIIFLLLILFNPTTLAYTRFATPDIMGALTSFIAILYSYIFLKNQTKKNAIILGSLCAVAFLTKYTALVPLIYIFISLFVLLVKERNRKTIINLATITFTFLFIVNAMFVFRGTADPIKNFEFVTTSTSNLVKNTFIGNIPSPLPREVLRGLDYVKWHTQEGHYNKFIYFMGKYYKHGSKLYFPTLFLIKTPAFVLVLFTIFFLYILKKAFIKPINEKSKFIMYVAITPFLFYFFFVVFLNSLNLGVRHILFTYLCAYLIIAYGFAQLYIKHKTLIKYLTGILIFYLLTINIQIYPHYLEYFNELIGGPLNGYKYAVKSNLDWRQDANFITNYNTKNNLNLMIDPQCGTNFTSGKKVAFRANRLFSIENGSPCYANVKNGKLINRITYVWFIYEF